MRVLILGECSGQFGRRFRAAGHECWTVDIKPADHAEDAPWHIVRSWDYWLIEHPELLAEFDLVIWHPECTKLTVAGNHVYAAGKPKAQERLDAMEYTRVRWEALKRYAKRAMLENPRGVLKHVIGKFGCTVQPFEFGDDASKTTDFWLHNLPPLVKDPAKRFPGRWVTGPDGKKVERWSNQTDSGQNKLGPDKPGEEGKRAAARAETYPGIADAIVLQYGSLA